MVKHKNTRLLQRGLVAACLAGALGAAVADPVSISGAFLNLENDAVNSVGYTAGQYMRIGADSIVSTNGTGALSVVATAIYGPTNQQMIRTLYPANSLLAPNQYLRNLYPTSAQLSGMLGPWTITATNVGTTTDTAVRTLSLPAGINYAPFVNTITLSGTSANPTFTWTPPPSTVVNGYRINIIDKSAITYSASGAMLNNGMVVSKSIQPNQTSYTVNAGDFNLSGYAFALGHQYSIQIGLMQTRDGSSTNLSNANLMSISRVYADFTPTLNGGPAVNLPVTLSNGSFQFNMAVTPGQTYYIDPAVATGYDYVTATGDANFQSVVLPTGIGDGLFDIYGYDSLVGNWVMLADDWAAGSVFDFGAGGVSRFRVTGIETSAGLDPNSTTAFVTGLTFASAGTFTGTQTPLTQDLTVPEPSTTALLALAMAGLILRRRTR